MGDALAKERAFGEFDIGVELVIVARETGKEHHVGLGDGAGRGLEQFP